MLAATHAEPSFTTASRPFQVNTSRRPEVEVTGLLGFLERHKANGPEGLSAPFFANGGR